MKTTKSPQEKEINEVVLTIKDRKEVNMNEVNWNKKTKKMEHNPDYECIGGNAYVMSQSCKDRYAKERQERIAIVVNNVSLQDAITCILAQKPKVLSDILEQLEHHIIR